MLRIPSYSSKKYVLGYMERRISNFFLLIKKIDESFDRDLENRSSVFQTIFVFTFIIIIGRNEENGTAMILYINIYIYIR